MPVAAPAARSTNSTTDVKVSPIVTGKRTKKSVTSKAENLIIVAQAVGSTKPAPPSKEEVAGQVSLPSNEDVPPTDSKRKSTVKEDLFFEEVYNQKANRELRSTYADKAHELASGCIQFWGVLISANGIIYGLTGKLMISDTALIAITTGVTINVLAAFLGVIRGLFPSDRTKIKKKKKIKVKKG